MDHDKPSRLSRVFMALHENRRGVFVCVAIFFALWVFALLIFASFWRQVLGTLPAFLDTTLGTTLTIIILSNIASTVAWFIGREFSKDKEKLGNAMINWGKTNGVLLAVWVVIILLCLFFVAPAAKHESAVSDLNTKSNELVVAVSSNVALNQRLQDAAALASRLATRNDSLQAQLEQQQKKTNEVQSASSLAEANKVLGNAQRLTAELKNANEESKQGLVLATMNERERLKKIAQDPILPPSINTVEGEIDTSATDATVKKMRTKELAEKALAITEEPSDNPVLTKCVPIVEYYVHTFQKKLRDMAAERGDRLIPTTFNAIEISRRPINEDLVVFKMERNSDWAFNVFFRRDGPAYFSLFIISGNIDLTCRFTEKGFSYRLTGVPQPGAAYGTGDYSELNKTVLLPVFSWIISTQNDRFPLRGPVEKEPNK